MTALCKNIIFIAWGRRILSYMLCSSYMKKGFQIINVAPDPAVMAIRGGKIVKKIKKLHAARGKGQ
ncbi:hypothetical protein Tco_0357900, partial [Tanacetum coccineum]